MLDYKPHALYAFNERDEMSSREVILNKVKASLGAVNHGPARERLTNPEDHPLITTPKADDSLPNIFMENVNKGYASVNRIEGMEGVANAISDYLTLKELGPEVRVPNPKGLEGLNYKNTLEGQVQSGDHAALTCCYLGVAETGTLIAHSSKDMAISSFYLADHHIVVVKACQIVAGLEDIWPHFRGLAKKTNLGLPRSINWITGPSMSADIEKKLTLGIHGPISLHIILIG